MYCVECGEKLTLVFNHKEGLVPFCKKCNEYRFPQFATAVSMVVTNRNKDRILLAKHKDQSDYILFAGYVKKGETAEKAVTREFKEETKLNTVKFRFMSSRYHEPRNVLMLNFLTMAETGEPEIDADEIDEIKWFNFDEALSAVRKDSTAEFFLKNAIADVVSIVLFGEAGRIGTRKNAGSKVSYQRYYDDPRGDDRRNYNQRPRPVAGFEFDDIIFDNRGDADLVLDQLESAIANYGMASVLDLYDLAGLTCQNYMADKYGWTDIQSARVARTRDGYILQLPRAIQIT